MQNLGARCAKLKTKTAKIFAPYFSHKNLQGVVDVARYQRVSLYGNIERFKKTVLR
ncbi:MAG: hypothetical protein KDD56_10600 [Bdellovibrionales bacterium]|nr:hypothetical protein [Bdellovibrionales bacterium]